MKLYGSKSALVFLLVVFHSPTPLPSECQCIIQIQRQKCLWFIHFHSDCLSAYFYYYFTLLSCCQGLQSPVFIYFVLSLDLPSSKSSRPRGKKGKFNLENLAYIPDLQPNTSPGFLQLPQDQCGLQCGYLCYASARQSDGGLSKDDNSKYIIFPLIKLFAQATPEAYTPLI